MEKVSDHIRALFYDLCPPKLPLPVIAERKLRINTPMMTMWGLSL